MQYILNEIYSVNVSALGDAKVFKSLKELIRHLSKIAKNEKLIIEGEELNLENLTNSLNARLTTVTVEAEGKPEIKWIITAF